MRRQRLSVVHYLNSLPLAWGFIQGRQKARFDLDFSPPSRCSDLLAEGGVDVGLIPAVEYLRIPGLKIVPELSIAAKREVRSVLLISKVPINELTTIAADNSSRTSFCLLQILLREHYHVNPEIISSPPDLKAMLGNHDAALVIGDVALKALDHGLFRYDLAVEWRQMTGKPFVFAFWGVREDSGHVETASFQESYQEGREHLEDIAEEHSVKLGLPADLLLLYLTECINYSLDAENLEGLRLFFRLAHQHRLVEKVKEPEFLS